MSSAYTINIGTVKHATFIRQRLSFEKLKNIFFFASFLFELEHKLK